MASPWTGTGGLGNIPRSFVGAVLNSIPGSFGSGTARNIADPYVDIYGTPNRVQGASTTNEDVVIRSGGGGQNPTQPTSTNYTGGISGTGASTPAYDPVELGLIDNQLGIVRDGIGRIGGQRNIGLENILNSYIEAQNQVKGQNALAKRDYDTTKQQTGEDFTNTRSNIRQQAGNQFTGLQRLLGSMGAGRSSAAQVLAPFAVGREAATRFGDVEQDFSRNQSMLDTADRDRENQYTSTLKQLGTDKFRTENELNSGLATRESDLQNQMAQLELQKQQLLGGNLDNVLSAIQPYQSRVQTLLSEIDNFGRQYQGAVKPVGNVKFARPDLAAYDYSQFSTPTLGGQRDPRSDYTSPLVSLLNQPEEEEKLV